MISSISLSFSKVAFSKNGRKALGEKCGLDVTDKIHSDIKIAYYETLSHQGIVAMPSLISSLLTKCAFFGVFIGAVIVACGALIFAFFNGFWAQLGGALLVFLGMGSVSMGMCSVCITAPFKRVSKYAPRGDCAPALQAALDPYREHLYTCGVRPHIVERRRRVVLQFLALRP
eukprot:gnl/Chilomastix_cuspidata/4379.p1 GENE.gnl/Chilomastix_cuspidata/4379~~gnl/Chilomastix_cuspidata/4379.p1  ORF type:complete len:173 (-),score=50.46 gnl/Chilomastix_cuspidata/4379:43-561(-)